MAWPSPSVRSSPLPIPRPWWGPGLLFAALLTPSTAAAASLAAPPPGLLWAGLMAIVGLCALVLALTAVVILLAGLGKQLAMTAASRQDIEAVAIASRRDIEAVAAAGRNDLRAEVAALRTEHAQSQSDIRSGIQGEFRALREEIRSLDEAVNKILRMLGEK